MRNLEPTFAVAFRAATLLQKKAGEGREDRPLALLIAVPRGAEFRPTVEAEIASARGRVVVKNEVLIASFPDVNAAAVCARALLRNGTEPPGAVGIGIHHAVVRLDAYGIPVGDTLKDLATVAGFANAGELIVSQAARAGLSEGRTAPVGKSGAIEAHELAWKEGQNIGRGFHGLVVAFLVVGVALLGWAVAYAYEATVEEHELELAAKANADPDAPPGPPPDVPLAPPNTPAEPRGAPGVTPDRTSTAAAPPEKEETKAARPARRTGTLTLVTTPEAEVLLKGKPLGKTPLFKVSLAAGTHKLELVGADGTRRVLQVPIEVNKTTAMRLRLDEVPAK